MNPMRGKLIPSSPGIVAAAIVHLPRLTDVYHEHRMDVVRLCLESMRYHLGMDAEILVWDNGSCEEMRRWLSEHYRPEYLILSRNIGKVSARTAILRMFHPETIVGISDDDMFFYPDWLVHQVDILRHFPNVGTVSGYPVITQFRWGCANTIQWAMSNPEVKVNWDRHIPEEWDFDFCTSIGRDYYGYQIGNVAGEQQAIGTYRGKEALLTGHHCQFISYCGRIIPFAKWDNLPMADEKPFDNDIDEAGLLRLTTTMRYTRHIGNVIDADIKQEAERYGLWQE